MEDKKTKLQTKDNQTWTLVAQRLYDPFFPHIVHSLNPGACRNVSLTTKMSVEIQIKSRHLPWAKKEQATKQIDFEKLFSDYWTTKERELTQLG